MPEFAHTALTGVRSVDRPDRTSFRVRVPGSHKLSCVTLGSGPNVELVFQLRPNIV